MKHRQVFHVVFFQDRGWWVAQCLERNLATANQDPRELPAKLQAVFRVQIEADLEAGAEPFSTLPRAPRRFWQLFQSAQHWHIESAVEPPGHFPAWAEMAVA